MNEPIYHQATHTNFVRFVEDLIEHRLVELRFTNPVRQEHARGVARDTYHSFMDDSQKKLFANVVYLGNRPDGNGDRHWWGQYELKEKNNQNLVHLLKKW